MNIRKKRQEALLLIIKDEAISTQDELIVRLREKGFDVTQATVSRDIKDTKIIKVQGPMGKSVYSPPAAGAQPFVSKYQSILSDAACNVDYAGYTCVIKCFSGMANAACAAIDSMHWDGVVGTLAGDDTIFVLCRTEAKAENLKDSIEKLID